MNSANTTWSRTAWLSLAKIANPYHKQINGCCFKALSYGDYTPAYN